MQSTTLNLSAICKSMEIFKGIFQLTWAVKMLSISVALWNISAITWKWPYLQDSRGLQRPQLGALWQKKQNSISIKKTTEKIPPRCPFLFFWSWIFTFQRSFPKHPYSRGPHVQHNKSRSVSWLVCETGLGLWVQLMFSKIF